MQSHEYAILGGGKGISTGNKCWLPLRLLISHCVFSYPIRQKFIFSNMRCTPIISVLKKCPYCQSHCLNVDMYMHKKHCSNNTELYHRQKLSFSLPVPSTSITSFHFKIYCSPGRCGSVD